MKAILLLLFVFFTGSINAQNLDSLQNQILKLKEYYDSYDDGSPESLKKAKYNDAVNEISGGTASEKDKADAYKIIDWYIKSDKAIGNDDGKPHPKPQTDELDKYLENTDEAKAAISYMNQQMGKLQNMSYSEFESYVRVANPMASTTDIKKAYNQMHQNDGKQVSISEKDNELTETQKQVKAFEVLNDPKNYEEFAKAFRVLDPNLSDSDIKEAWNNRNK